MPRRSMAKTHSDKMHDIDNKNPENKDPQSVQTNTYNKSAELYGKFDSEKK